MGERQGAIGDGEGRNKKEKGCRDAVCSPKGTDQSDPQTYAEDWCWDPSALYNPFVDSKHA